MSTLDWARLVESGRAKAIGVPWNEKEAYLVLNRRVPAEYVRYMAKNNIPLTYEEYKKLNLKFPRDNKEVLLEKAKKLGSSVTGDAPIDVIKEEIESLEKADSTEKAEADSKEKESKYTELQLKAKEKGITGWHVMKDETIQEKLKDLNETNGEN